MTLKTVYKNCTIKPYSFLVIDATLASDNPLRFRKNLSERIQKLIMAIDDKINNEKIISDFNREASKVSPLSSGKMINKNMLHVKKYYFLITDKQ